MLLYDVEDNNQSDGTLRGELLSYRRLITCQGASVSTLFAGKEAWKHGTHAPAILSLNMRATLSL